MSTRLLLEGTDLRALMLRVRDEMGPEATIVRAERVRTGGVAGFFAREHFELTVEVPEEVDSSAGGPAPKPPSSRKPGTVAEPVGLAALMAAADAVEAEPEVSTTGEGFTQVLAAMQGLTEPHPASQAAPPKPDVPATPVDPVHTLPAIPDFEKRNLPRLVTAWRPAQLSPSPVVHPDDDVTEAGTETAKLPDTLQGSELLSTDRTEPVEDLAEEVVEEPVEDLAEELEDLSAPHPSVDVASTEATGASLAALLGLGVPTRLLAGFDEPDVEVPLSMVVRAFERAPDPGLVGGRIVVVAGAAEVAVEVATQLAHRARLAPQDVVLAGDVPAIAGHGRRVQTPQAAARIRQRLSDAVPVVVALGAQDPSTAADLLAAFEPDTAWAAVDARLRAIELRRWLRVAGARRGWDGIAAEHLFEAQSPGQMLNLGVPVGWIDGLPASPVVWAAVLSERLVDDARWD